MDQYSIWTNSQEFTGNIIRVFFFFQFLIMFYFQYGYDAGVPWEWVCYILVAFSACMLPITLFCLPVDRIRDESEKGRACIFKKIGDIAVISAGQVGKFQAIPGK